MKLTRTSVASVAVLCTLGLVGGGAALVSPASASAGVNWGHIFKKEIKPRADKRYYTKKKANALFSVKSALLNYYTKAESDAKYSTPASVATALGGYYTKAQSDAKYAPAVPPVIRGNYVVGGYAGGAGTYFTDNISYGVTLSAAPVIHFILVGGVPPAGCSGTVLAPNAAPGNLCVFAANVTNSSDSGTFDPTTPGGAFSSSNPMGIAVYARSTAAGQVFNFGSWAVRPVALSTSRVVPHAAHHSGAGVAR